MRAGLMRTLLRRASPLPLLPVVAFALTLASVTPARADDAQVAREHFQKGTSYYDLGRYADAIREFEAAYEIKNDPALLYNLAQSHRLAGNSEQALHFYRTYLRRMPKAPNRTEIEGRITQLEQVVAQKGNSQTAPPNVTTPPGGTTPPPGGTETTPPANTTPGTTTPPLTTPAETPPTTTMPPGTTATAVISTAPSPEAVNPRAKRYERNGIGGVAAGGVLVLIGLAEGIRAAAASNEVKNTANAGQPFDPAVQKRGKDFQAAEAIFLALGVVVGGAGGALYLYGHRHEHDVTVTPMASGTSAGGMLRVTF